MANLRNNLNTKCGTYTRAEVEAQKYLTGDARALERCVRELDGIAYHLSNKWYLPGWELDDKVQIARIEIVAAIRNWNPSKGRLSTLCTTVINHEFAHIRVGLQRLKRGGTLTGYAPSGQTISLSHDTEDTQNCDIELPSPEDVSAEVLSRGQVQYILSYAPNRYRRILELVAAGLTYAEVGERLGISGQRVAHVLRNMARRLHLAGADEELGVDIHRMAPKHRSRCARN
jgi:RNA polymerase sigma factor (sigma-70 family)